MKKIIIFFLSVLLVLSVVASCGVQNGGNEGKNDDKEEKIKIITTIFPIYDWIREVIGEESERFELKMLLDTGVDLHSFQPTADDIVSINKCDLFVYVGGESDSWASDILASGADEKREVCSLLEVLGDLAKTEEAVEGMEAEEHEHEEGEEHDEEGGEEYDEHVWLSLKNASVIVKALAEKIASLDPEKKDIYKANADAYTEKLNALDKEYEKAVDEAEKKVLLFGDRFPFRYLVDDYDITYYAAFSGCSAESEASFETIKFLADKLDELGLCAIMKIESSDGSVARTIKEATETKDQEILTLDSMQSVTGDELESGISYLSVMEENLSVLKDALK